MQSCWRKDRKPLIFIVFMESVAMLRYLNLRRFVELAALSLRRGGVARQLAGPLAWSRGLRARQAVPAGWARGRLGAARGALLALLRV